MLKRIQELNCPFPQMSLDEIPNFPGDKRCFLGEISMFHHFSHGFIMFHLICPIFSLEFSIQKKTSPSPVQEQLRDVQLLRSTEAAFAALTAEGTVVAWGMAGAGGHVPQRVKAPPWGRKWPNWENLVRRCVCFWMAKVGIVVNIWILLFLKNDEFSRFMLKRFDERQWTRPQSPNFARNGRNQNYYPTEWLLVHPFYGEFFGDLSVSGGGKTW